jgi:hypothetical protein
VHWQEKSLCLFGSTFMIFFSLERSQT